MDSMEYDIKLMLMLSPAKKLQWKEIFKTLWQKHEKEHKTKNSFSVTLQRKLNALVGSGDLKKEEKGHQHVFYFVPKTRQKKVMEEIEKTSVLKKFDAFWDSFSSDQRKKLIQDSAVQQQAFISFIGRFSIEFLSSMQELVEPWISNFENPTDDIKAKYSQKEREQILREIHDLRKDSEELKNEIVRDNQPLSNEEFRERLSLTQEFLVRVVPKYPGGWREAMLDLMRKAVEEAKRGKPDLKT
jgi:hypothetical protein